MIIIAADFHWKARLATAREWKLFFALVKLNMSFAAVYPGLCPVNRIHGVSMHVSDYELAMALLYDEIDFCVSKYNSDEL